jgi:hypothetical protein
MKYLLTFLLILMVSGCAVDKEDVKTMLEEYTVCTWWHKHDICVCYGTYPYLAWAMHVPDKVCDK